MPNPVSFRRGALTKRLLSAAWPVARGVLGWIEPYRRPVDRDAAPVFVCGSPHSGTTLLLRLLGQHPNIHSVLYESGIFRHPRPRRTLVITERTWLAEAASAGKMRFCEKTPEHVHQLDRLLRAFPSARVLVTVRDGRDVAASLGARWGDIERAIGAWARSIESCRPWLDDHRVRQVRYEDLVRDTESTMRTVCQHVGEPFSAEVVEPHLAEKPFNYQGVEEIERPTDGGRDNRRLRAWQVNQPIFDGTGRWRESLTPEELDLCLRIAGPQLVELGYSDTPA